MIRAACLIVMMLCATKAHAFGFTLVSFGEEFDQEAQKQGSSLRAEAIKCSPDDGGSCSYKVGGILISVHIAGGVEGAKRVAAVAPYSSDMIVLKEAEPILSALCSPEADQTKRAMYLFGLNTAFDNDEVVNPSVRVVYGGVRYSLRHMADGQGDLFQIDDNGAWREEPRIAQIPATAVASTEQPTKQADVEPPVATTAEIVAPIAPGDYKVADPADLHAAPRKFLGKPIEVRNAHCYYADVDDYRCLAPGYSSVAIFATSIEPSSEKVKIEAECGALKVAMTQTCQRNLHFVLDDWSEDRPSNTSTRTLLKPKSVVILPMQVGKRRK